MTKLREIFEKPVDRAIEGVIKADDEASLKIELEEYVITNEIAKRLERFLDAYNNYDTANGVWISGFFGSGKSHLLKMLALLLENREVGGSSAYELFKQKCADNEILAADLKRAVAIPSKSILFNIDQKADVISKEQIDALLSVFQKVFDEMCGYYGKQPHIAQFERDLDSRGVLAAFRESYLSVAGKPWERGREQALLESANVAEAYAAATGEDPAEAQGILARYRQDFRSSIEDFADKVKAYIDTRGPAFRLNFFVDEVGQYIADNVIRALVREVASQTAAPAEVLAWIRQRRQSHWYPTYKDLYEAIGYAAEFQQAMAQVSLGMTTLAEGVQRYVKSWFRIDQLYRKFIWHMQRSGQATLMRELFEQVENHYVNSYLLRLNDGWQAHVDAAERWSAAPIPDQRTFYRGQVGDFRRRDQKVCVIISDALRYEVAEELLGRIRSLDRYEAEIEPMLGSLPSYTQLGMASLLPNSDLRIADNDTSTVFVDGQSSQGLENRKKILAAGRLDDRTTALKAEDLMGLDKEAARSLIRDHDVVYIYHNLIDAIGDKPVSEDRVFEAAEDTLEEIVRLVKKLTGANASNLIVTADHGFIYQHRPIEESDFSSASVDGETVHFRDRRFILGHGLQANHGLRRFTPEQAGLQGDVEILIPKSINRLRRQGSGSRFVHGGATLQEVVVPVVTIGKKRQSDTASVEVEIIGSANRLITASQLSVRFYQATAVTDKVQPRRLRAGIYAQSGELISDSHELDFDFRTENAREREVAVRFLLSREADAFNGQEVVLRLEERHAETSHYKEYRSVRYTLRRSFTNDFDF